MNTEHAPETERFTSDEHRSVSYRRKALPLRFVRAILRREQAKLYTEYARVFPPAPSQRVLDLGVNGSLERPELHFFEHLYPYRERIVALGLEPPERFGACYPEIPYVVGRRGAALPFADGEFDIVFCNAVIEHVGSHAQQRDFLGEVLRVGRAAFVTTPNRWYPVELHTVLPLVHYLPSPLYRRTFRALGFEFFSKEENLNLLDRRSLAALLPPDAEADIRVHRFLGLPSNLMLVVGAP
jgi:hypothetical protein